MGEGGPEMEEGMTGARCRRSHHLPVKTYKKLGRGRAAIISKV